MEKNFKEQDINNNRDNVVYAKTLQAAGGVLVRMIDDTWYYLALLQKRISGKIEWVAPKGHIEMGEDSLQAATREIAEETGLKNINMVDFVDQQTFSFEDNGYLYKKTVYWYLFKVENTEGLILNEEEGFILHKWIPYKEALELFSHESFTQIIKMAAALLRK